MRLFKILFFRLILGFVNNPRVFSILSISDVISEVKRYIQIFDVISELYCLYVAATASGGVVLEVSGIRRRKACLRILVVDSVNVESLRLMFGIIFL